MNKTLKNPNLNFKMLIQKNKKIFKYSNLKLRFKKDNQNNYIEQSKNLKMLKIN